MKQSKQKLRNKDGWIIKDRHEQPVQPKDRRPSRQLPLTLETDSEIKISLDPQIRAKLTAESAKGV